MRPQFPKEKKENKTIYALDLETWGLESSKNTVSKRFAFGVITNVETEEATVYYNPDSMLNFLRNASPCVVYAHNGLNYDVFSFFDKNEMRHSAKAWKGSKLLELISGYLENEGTDEETFIPQIYWRDTTDLFPLSLSKLGQALGFPKGKTPVDFIRGNKREITPEDISYCIQDTIIVARALKGLTDSYCDWIGVPHGSLELPLTAGSLAYRVWCSTSFPESWFIIAKDGKKLQMGITKKEFNNNAKEAFKGGRVEILCEPGKKYHGVRSIDANSLYPSVMLNTAMPDIMNVRKCWSSPKSLLNNLYNQDRVYWADVDMTNVSGKGFLASSTAEGRRFWAKDTHTGWLMGNEIRHGIENGWEITAVRDINYAPAIYPFKDFVTTFYNLRLEYKKNNDPREAFTKLLLNNLFGKMGQRKHNIRIDAPHEILKIMKKKNWRKKYEIDWYDADLTMPFLIKKVESQQTPSSQFFPIAATITSEARVRLDRARLIAGDEALYMDTDSLHYVDTAHERIMDQVSMGENLGQWKSEQEESISSAIYWEKKVYVFFNEDGSKKLVKHKGVKVTDSITGEFLPNAGDLTKPQPFKGVFSYAEAWRRKVQPGDSKTGFKISAKWGEKNS